jgi:transcriptional regulator with XRE-family HTH domain
MLILRRMNDWKFCQSLKKRGLSQTALARLAGVGRCHLSQVLSNVPGRGGHTRRKLFPHLTVEEVLMLGWAGEYADWLKKNGAAKADVNAVLKKAAELEQTSTENNVPISIESGVAA